MLLNRISWIDVARGIGIILVIQGHALGADSYRHLIYAFHMPLFFFLSGLVFDYRKYSFSQNFKKSVNNILIPYFLFAFLFYFLWWLENGNLRFEFVAFLKHLQGIIYANSSNLFFNLVLWFLPCLFITKITFAYLSLKLKNKYLLFISILGFSLLGYFSFLYFPDLTLPFGIESAFTAIAFFAFGSILKTDFYEKINSIKKNKIIIIMVLSALTCILAGLLNYYLYGRQIDIRLNNLGNYFIFYIGALSGIVATVGISILINKNKILEYIGKKSLVLFVFHNFVFFYITKFLLVFINKETLWSIKDYYLSYFYTIAALLIILGFTYLYKKLKLPTFSFLKIK